MQFHPTPYSVAKIIRKHIPHNIGKVLEPSAGDGALISVLDGRGASYKDVFMVDISSKNVSILSERYPLSNIYCADFLTWDSLVLEFNTIISNPPFHAKSGVGVLRSGRKVPIEFAFVEKCLQLLAVGGVYIAILPSSVIASNAGEALRKLLLSYSVLYSYQLPGKSFDGVESVFFVLVVRNGKPSRNICLRKISATGSLEQLVVSRNDILDRGCRLDFDYHSVYINGVNFLEMLKVKYRNFDLLSPISAKRGRITGDYRNPLYVHSTYYNNGQWSLLSSGFEEYVIVCKRVSRDCNYTFGVLEKSKISSCTDCVVIIESDSNILMEVLFFLRTVFSSEFGSRYLVRGTGARYLSVGDLNGIEVLPMAKLFPKEYGRFVDSYRMGDMAVCRDIERSVFLMMFYGSKVSAINGSCYGKGNISGSDFFTSECDEGFASVVEI